MKKILSDFLNLLYPKTEGEFWTWVETVVILPVLGFVTFMFIMFGT